ncbi:hypothetical protein FA13DRAFT_1466500 [Coprinellus micaceus]|uniref:Uncharacterized protein n=1 Tax=Coprinellus micaceus TaxID=71717 RepID=A0A4Y7SMF7_COPMI|nr:hypothetical protein FA13DRAFT_1466500 [Coprinellus micaceus]
MGTFSVKVFTFQCVDRAASISLRLTAVCGVEDRHVCHDSILLRRWILSETRSCLAVTTRVVLTTDFSLAGPLSALWGIEPVLTRGRHGRSWRSVLPGRSSGTGKYRVEGGVDQICAYPSSTCAFVLSRTLLSPLERRRLGSTAWTVERRFVKLLNYGTLIR